MTSTSAGEGVVAHSLLPNYAFQNIGRIPQLVFSRILQFPLLLEQTYELLILLLFFYTLDRMDPEGYKPILKQRHAMTGRTEDPQYRDQ